MFRIEEYLKGGNQTVAVCLILKISIELSTMLWHSAIFVYVPRALRMRRTLCCLSSAVNSFIHQSAADREWMHTLSPTTTAHVTHVEWSKKQRNFYPQMCLISINLLNESIALKFHFTWARTRFCNFFAFLKSNRFRVFFLFCLFCKKPLWIRSEGHVMAANWKRIL